VLEALAAGYFDALDDPVGNEIKRNSGQSEVNGLHFNLPRHVGPVNPARPYGLPVDR